MEETIKVFKAVFSEELVLLLFVAIAFVFASRYFGSYDKMLEDEKLEPAVKSNLRKNEIWYRFLGVFFKVLSAIFVIIAVIMISSGIYSYQVSKEEENGNGYESFTYYDNTTNTVITYTAPKDDMKLDYLKRHYNEVNVEDDTHKTEESQEGGIVAIRRESEKREKIGKVIYSAAAIFGLASAYEHRKLLIYKLTDEEKEKINKKIKILNVGFTICIIGVLVWLVYLYSLILA